MVAAGSNVTKNGSGIAARVGEFLELNYNGSSKDKRIAQDFNISPEMARKLRRGLHWTPERIDQVAKRWPKLWEFLYPDSNALHRRLDVLLYEVIKLRHEVLDLKRDLEKKDADEAVDKTMARAVTDPSGRGA